MIGRVAMLVLLLAACTGSPPASPTSNSDDEAAGGVKPSGGAAATLPPVVGSATPPAGRVDLPTRTNDATPTPARTTITPTEVIAAESTQRSPDSAGPDDQPFSINMVTFGDHVWATVDGGLMRIDALTGEVMAVEHSVPAGDARYLAASRDWIWLSDFDSRTVQRVDPVTGGVTATMDVPGQPLALLSGDDGGLWAPMNGGPTYRLDPDRMEIVGEPIPHRASAYGLGSLWAGQDETGAVLRIQPDTGDVLAEISVSDDDGGCRVGGRFPDAVWSWCDLLARGGVTRLDPESGQVIGTVDLGGAPSSYSGVRVIDDGAWFALIPRSYRTPGGLVRVDLQTNEVDRRLLTEPGIGHNEFVVAGDSLWLSSIDHQQIWRFPLDLLAASR